MTNYLSDIRIFTTEAYLERSNDWIKCDGRLLKINDYKDLFKILGVQFGGDGVTTFAIPDLTGLLPVGVGRQVDDPTKFRSAGSKGGLMSNSLAFKNMPKHTHRLQAMSTSPTISTVTDAILSTPAADKKLYNSKAPGDSEKVILDMGMLGTVGASRPISNVQPVLGLIYVMAVVGYFPTRS